MSALELDRTWLQLLALLAAEVGLVALVVALLRRGSRSAAWGRAVCQAGIIAVLALTVCELSGAARGFGGWAKDALSWRGEAAEAVSPRVQTTAHPIMPVLPMDTVAAPGQSAAVLAPKSRPRSAETPLRGDGLPSASEPARALWVCFAWAVGALLVGARVGVARCLFLVFQLRCRAVAEPGLAETVTRLASALGMRRRVRVVQSARLTSPIAFGFVWPTVGLPEDFARRFEPVKRDCMLAHELAHLAAHDTCWCLLADVATAVLWWHPGVWWLRRQLHLASEMAADEASLLVAEGPQALAECLVELGGRMAQPLMLGQLRVSGFRSHLGRRVHRLVLLEDRAWSPPPKLGAAMTRILGPAALTAAVVLCTAWAAPQALTKGTSMKLMQLSWKRSLAAVSLLAAINGPQATVALAQSDQPAPPPAPAPEITPAVPAGEKAQASEAPAAPKPPASAAEDAFAKRYGLRAGAPAPGASPAPTEEPKRGAKLEAKLNQIVLDQVKFEGLPLSEVLRYLNDASLKHDPFKAGINFLINPNAPRTAVDPFTGLPVTAEQIDVGAVVIQFNMALRNVTMKNVLDAIVTVADHPIQYAVEDFAVVFSAKPEVAQRQAAEVPPAPRPSQPLQLPQPPTFPGQIVPATPPPAPKHPKRTGTPVSNKPQTFNVDFGSATGEPSQQVGPAAAGKEGDIWNGVAIGFNDHHTETDLDFASGDPSPIEVEMFNLGGCWHFNGAMGLDSPMLDHYQYPTANHGGNSRVIIHKVPAGKYQLYIYGHGPDAPYCGDYTVRIGGRSYGRKATTTKEDVGRLTKWVEGMQYVKFSSVKVGQEEEIDILIQPGGEVTDPSGRTFRDAMICGLQLIPVK
jgi:beta-lactamase regulating signal transducer with metallopeptidase domain